MRKIHVVISLLVVVSMACSLTNGLMALGAGASKSLEGLSGQNLAVALAKSVTTARSNKRQTESLLQVLDAVHIGVYNPDGEEVLRGAERDWGDFYLYDFQVVALAENLDRRQTYDLNTVAAILEYAGLQVEGRSPTAADVLQGLRLAIVDSRQYPDDPYSLVPLLIQEIGLQRPDSPYDLSTELAPEQVQLDGLQLLLITGDILLPYVYATEPIAGPLDVGALGGGGRQALHLPPELQGCSEISEKLAKIPYWGKTIVRMLNTGASAGSKVLPVLEIAKQRLAPVMAAFVSIEAIHGVLLAIGIQVKEVEPKVGPTHYGHDSPGKELQFGIRVVNHADFGEIAVRCGWLTTVKFPPKGPVSGVHVVWFTDGLEDHGTLDCQKGLVFSCYSTTGADGVAKLTFMPKDEQKPFGQGMEREEIGIVTGLAQYLSSQGNSFVGKISEHITPLTGSTVWSVRFHKPFAFHIKGTAGEFSIDQDVCDYTKPFTMTARSAAGNLTMSMVPANPGYEKGGTYTDTGTMSGGGFTWTSSGAGTYTINYDGDDQPVALELNGQGCGADGMSESCGSASFSLKLTPPQGCGS